MTDDEFAAIKAAFPMVRHWLRLPAFVAGEVGRHTVTVDRVYGEWRACAAGQCQCRATLPACLAALRAALVAERDALTAIIGEAKDGD